MKNTSNPKIFDKFDGEILANDCYLSRQYFRIWHNILYLTGGCGICFNRRDKFVILLQFLQLSNDNENFMQKHD